jgi:DnaJ-class molecular chaperone
MKLLMENWRKFLTEVSLQHVKSLEDAYDILGVEQGDKLAAKKVWRNIAKVGHSDSKEYDPEKQELFLKAAEAWAVIEQPDKYKDKFQAGSSSGFGKHGAYDDIWDYVASEPEAGAEPYRAPASTEKSKEDKEFDDLMKVFRDRERRRR